MVSEVSERKSTGVDLSDGLGFINSFIPSIKAHHWEYGSDNGGLDQGFVHIYVDGFPTSTFVASLNSLVPSSSNSSCTI